MTGCAHYSRQVTADAHSEKELLCLETLKSIHNNHHKLHAFGQSQMQQPSFICAFMLSCCTSDVGLILGAEGPIMMYHEVDIGFLSFVSSYIAAESSGTWFLTLFASRANLSVLTVSAQLACAGEMLAIMTVFELPPRESCKQHVH